LQLFSEGYAGGLPLQTPQENKRLSSDGRKKGPSITDLLDVHYKTIVKAIFEGRVVPFLGAGVNLHGRPADQEWEKGQTAYLPSSNELATHLAEHFGCPPDQRQDLVRVSQYVAVTVGFGPLYEALHELFTGLSSTPVHPVFSQASACGRKHLSPQLIVTTNYDDLLERAFLATKQPFDVVSYVAEGEYRGKFLHRPPEGEVLLIERPNEYRGLALEQRPVILKIHGAVDRDVPERDSFVITEDHYINFLTRTDISNLIPVTLAAKLRKSHFLFLGYSLRDWNLRVILHRIWGEQKLVYKSWVIQAGQQELDQKLWMQRDVEILNVSLEDYLAELIARVQGIIPSGGGL
jgi:hypothetical protein